MQMRFTGGSKLCAAMQTCVSGLAGIPGLATTMGGMPAAAHCRSRSSSCTMVLGLASPLLSASASVPCARMKSASAGCCVICRRKWAIDCNAQCRTNTGGPIQGATSAIVRKTKKGQDMDLHIPLQQCCRRVQIGWHSGPQGVLLCPHSRPLNSIVQAHSRHMRVATSPAVPGRHPGRPAHGSST